MASNTGLITKLNSAPYFDDYNENKNFYQILFRPGTAVQGRELTQLQTILQKQISRFGDNIFKEGSIVSGGQYLLDYDYNYVKIKDLSSTSSTVNVSTYKNTVLSGVNSGVNAYVIDVADGIQTQANTKTFFVKYLNSGSDFNSKTFQNNETLQSSVGNNPVSFSANACGKGSGITVNEGILYSKEHFVKFLTQSVILDRYTDKPSVTVGWVVEESIITENDDYTLLSPETGSSQYGAPGAHRLKLNPILKVYQEGEQIPDDFIEFMKLKDGIIQESYTKTQYNVILDEMARRTYDESGNYYVKGMDVRLREHLDTGSNEGYLTLENGGNNSLLAIGIESGKAYVLGYGIEKLVTSYITTEKGIDWKQLEQQIISTNYGSYVIVDEFVGSWNIDSGAILSLYDTAQNRVSSGGSSAASQTGTLLGTARFKAVEVANRINSSNVQYRLYLYDIKMTGGDFSQVKSIFYNNTSIADMGCDIVLENNKAVLKESSSGTMVYPLATGSVRTIRDENNDVETTFEFLRTSDVTISSGGTFSVSTGSSNEIYPYSTGNLSSVERNEFIVSLNGTASVSMSGTVSINSGANTLSGSGTNFTRLNVGDKLSITGLSGYYIISNITNDTSLSFYTNAASTVSGAAYVKYYNTGDILDFTSKGSTAGTDRTINVTSSTSATFDLKETLSGSVSASVTYKLNKINAQEIKKTIRKNRYVIINCSSAGTTGPFDLGFSDIFQIRSVRMKTGSTFSAADQGTDVTENFILDNGQRDSFYDHGNLIKTGGDDLTSSTYLLVCLDYFYHDYSQGVGYFSVDSYPIDDVFGSANNNAIRTEDIPTFTSPLTGATYNLRNAIDARPSIQNTAADATSVGSADTNPSSGTSIYIPLGGIRTPVPNGTFNMDYSYYMGRKDLVVLNSSGVVYIKRGVPSLSPITPTYPTDGMVLAKLIITPYPSLAASYATLIGKSDQACTVTKSSIKRFTMKDIGTLQDRVENLETQMSLSLLEKNAVDMKILDSDGLDRFKNGIFVDSFTSHTLGDITNPDYRIAIDGVEGSIRPVFEMNDVKLEYASGSGITKANNLILLNYSETSFINQPYASKNRNAAGQYYSFKGVLTLDPPEDYWVDTEKAPDVQINIDGYNDAWEKVDDSWEIQWNSWQSTVTGVSSENISWKDNTDLFLSSGGHSVATEINGLTGNYVGDETGAGTIVTTTTTSSTRTGTKSYLSSQTTTENIGDTVVDISIIPYIRAQTIKVYGLGLKATTRIFCYFDSEDMSNYCTPCTSSFVISGNEGDNLVTDSNGNVYFLLRLPADGKRFRTGTKKVRITDSITDDTDATTSAETYFTAEGIVKTTQSTIVSTTTPIIVTEQVSETVVSTESTVTGVVDPIAQTFYISVPDGAPGMFLTSIDLYFYSKDTVHGAQIELRALDSSSNITGTVLPYSTVVIPASAINISDDASVATRCYFPSPVYVLTETEYAFVVKPVGNNPNISIWTSKLGDNDITTGTRISAQPYSGVMYVSSNNRSWSAIQDEDIKFTLYRAQFSTNTQGTVNLKNQNIEKFKVSSISADFTYYGEPVYGETRLTLSSVTGGTINTGYSIVGSTSDATGTVTNVSGSVYRVIPTSNESYSNGESVTVKYANGSITAITAQITNQITPYGTLSKYKQINSSDITLELVNTFNTFSVGEQLKGSISNSTAIVSSVLPTKYSVADVEVSFLAFDKTSINWYGKTSSNTGSLDSSFSSININNNTTYDTERVLYGYSQENSVLSGNKSLQTQAIMTTESSYISPVLDLNRSHVVLVHNILNNDYTNENSNKGGNAINKYISQKITLAEGQDAEDLNVYLTAYRPPDTDVKVYAKLLNGEDSDLFTDIDWIELTRSSKDVYSSVENSSDFKEYLFVLPSSMMTGDNGEIQYTNSNSVTFTGYKYFSIKIVLIGNNSAKIPRASDARAIALQI